MSEENPLSDMVIIVDTREQDPYRFKGHLTIRDNLVAGDYSIQGFEKEISIERKSITDFVGSITHGRERFKKMLYRMYDIPHRYILVEGSLDDVMKPISIKSSKVKAAKGCVRPMSEQYVNVHPNAIFQTIVSIMLRYQVIFMFARTREEAEFFVTSTFKKFMSIKREDQDE